MKKIFLFISIPALLSAAGCKKFVDVNTDPNHPLTVQEKILLAPIEYTIADSIANGGEATAAAYSNHFMQVMCYNQVALNFGTYYFVNTNMDGIWTTAYTSCLQNLKLLTETAATNGNSNYTAIAEVLTAYTLGFLTDFWGDIPYSHALQGSGNFTPAYDKQEDIYKTIQSLLDQAVVYIDKDAGLKVGADDYYYQGNMTQWRKLAFSLKARYYMHLTRAPGYSAATLADLALAALQNGIMSTADEWKFVFPGGSTSQNIWYVNMLPYSTLVASTAIIDTLKARNDPRLPFLIAPSINTGLYTGRAIGTPTIGVYDDYAKLGSAYCSVNGTGYIMPYTEVGFLQAEATFIQSGAAAAQPIYQAAIATHMTQLGVDPTAANAYITSRGTLTASNAIQRIMEEKKIADFLSPENYTDWRRTGFPALTIVPNAQAPDIPRRLIYPQAEINTNPQPQQSASLTDRVWWDGQ